MMVVPEGGSLLYMNETHVLDGHTGVEHSLPVPRIYKDMIAAVREEQVGYTPTLIVGYGGLSGEYYWYQHTQRLGERAAAALHAARSRRRALAAPDDGRRGRFQSRPDCARARSRSPTPAGSVQLGAHGQLQGLGAHWELWMLQQGGMTPIEALRAATVDGARYLGLDGELGLDRKGQARRPDRARPQSAREHPELRFAGDGDAQRAAVRREDAERDRQHAARAAAVLVRTA